MCARLRSRAAASPTKPQLRFLPRYPGAGDCKQWHRLGRCQLGMGLVVLAGSGEASPALINSLLTLDCFSLL